MAPHAAHGLQFSLMYQCVLMVCKDHDFQMFGTDLQNRGQEKLNI